MVRVNLLVGSNLPESIIGAIGAGGTDAMDYAPAVAFGLTLVAVMLSASAIVFSRRDVTS